MLMYENKSYFPRNVYYLLHPSKYNFKEEVTSQRLVNKYITKKNPQASFKTWGFLLIKSFLL